jgi:nucleotidyltransferase substrate binding protein (TIGR01987 family)
MLELGSLDKAVRSLSIAIQRWQDFPEDKEVRDSVVQRFEYTYELCHKMLRRQLQDAVANPSEVASLDYKALIREAAKFRLIEHPENWFEYRRKRNLTSHTYDEDTAEEVASSAIHFLYEARDLLTCLQKF